MGWSFSSDVGTCAGVMIALQISNLGLVNVYPEVFHGFPNSLQKKN
jgi:hypothetical protein